MQITEGKTGDYAEELERNGAIAFVPSGISMWPTLKNRGQSVVVIKKPGKLSRYDVALYIRPGHKYVLHRVMTPTKEGYLMCGDSQLVYERVAEEHVIGVMEGFYRKDKYISAADEKYKREIENWYSHKKRRKFRLKLFYFWNRVKGKLSRMFRGNKKEQNV